MTERPWLDQYPKHVKWNQEFTGKPLYEIVANTASKIPNNIALDNIEEPP